MTRSLPPLSDGAESLLAQERIITPVAGSLRQRALSRAKEALSERPSGIVVRAERAWWARGGRTLPVVAAVFGVAGLAAAGAQVYRTEVAQVVSAVEADVPAKRNATPFRSRALSAPTRASNESADVASVEAPVLGPQPPLGAPALGPEPSLEASEPKAPTARQRSAKVVNQAASSESYAIELGLLEPARSAVGQGSFSAALSSLGKHQQQFPQGQLRQEREALKVRALWGLGQTTQARSAAAEFRKSYPKSGLLSWMKDTATPER